MIAVAGGVDTSFVYDIRADFAADGLAGFRGIKLAAFPAPVFSGLQMGDPLVAVGAVEVAETADGFAVFFDPVQEANNQPLRVTFKLRLLEHNTPVNAWLLGAGRCTASPHCGRRRQQRCGHRDDQHLHARFPPQNRKPSF